MAHKRIATLPDGTQIPYDEYQRTSHWRRIRKAAHARDQGCVVCRTTDNLDVHHKTYDRVGHEDLDDLVVLCRKHHEKVHQRHGKLGPRKGMTLEEATVTYIAIQHKHAERAARRARAGVQKRPRPSKAAKNSKREAAFREVQAGLAQDYGHLLAEGNADRRERARQRLLR